MILNKILQKIILIHILVKEYALSKSIRDLIILNVTRKNSHLMILKIFPQYICQI